MTKLTNVTSGVKGFVATPAHERFWAKVNKDGPIPEGRSDLGPCWVWTAGLYLEGYGSFALRHRISIGAHRYSYEQLVGPIPAGLPLDHLCRNRPCVRPSHLEPVTERVNILRGISPSALGAKASHCPKGHVYDLVNTRITHGRRHCRMCAHDADVARRDKHAADARARRRRRAQEKSNATS